MTIQSQAVLAGGDQSGPSDSDGDLCGSDNDDSGESVGSDTSDTSNDIE